MTNENESLVVGYLVTCFISEEKFETMDWKYTTKFTEHNIIRSKISTEPHPMIRDRQEFVIKELWTLSSGLDKEHNHLMKEEILDEYYINCKFSPVWIEEFYEIKNNCSV